MQANKVSINKVIIVGRLGRDAEARYMPWGNDVTGIAKTSTMKSKKADNVFASAADTSDMGIDAGAAGTENEGDAGGSGSGDDDGGDGDPDSDRRALPPLSPIDYSSNLASLHLAPARSPGGTKHPKQSRSPKPPYREKRVRRAHWMAFLLTLTTMGLAAWFVEKGHSPLTASAFAGVVAKCILAILKE